MQRQTKYYERNGCDTVILLPSAEASNRALQKKPMQCKSRKDYPTLHLASMTVATIATNMWLKILSNEFQIEVLHFYSLRIEISALNNEVMIIVFVYL